MFTFTNRVAVASLLALTALQMPRAHAQYMMPGVMRTGFYGGAAMFAPTYFNPSGYGTAFMYVPSYYGYSSPYYSYGAYGYGYGMGGYGMGGYGGYGAYGGGYASPYGYGGGSYITSYYGDYYSRSGSGGRYRPRDYDDSYGDKALAAKKSDLFYQDQPAAAARHNPSVNEILSGAALNDLLADLRHLREKPDKLEPRTLQVPLEEQERKHINVTRGAGNIALLRSDSKLTWPIALNTASFKAEREKMSSLCTAAVRQAGFNSFVDAGTLSALDTNVEKLRKKLQQEAAALSPPEYIEANTFLNNLDDAIRALHAADVGKHFTGEYALKAKTFPELVAFMNSQKLLFTRAVPGDEKSYLKLFYAMDQYHQAVNAQTVRK